MRAFLRLKQRVITALSPHTDNPTYLVHGGTGTLFAIGNDPYAGVSGSTTSLNITNARAFCSQIVIAEPHAPYLSDGTETITGFTCRVQNLQPGVGTVKMALFEATTVGLRRYPPAGPATPYIATTELTRSVPALMASPANFSLSGISYKLTAGKYYAVCAMAADAVFMGLILDTSNAAARTSKDQTVTGGNFNADWTHTVESHDSYLAAIGVK